jgi:HNH endonuclease
MADRTGIEWTEATWLFGGPLPKRCSICREVKSASEFHRDHTRADGIAFVCWACRCPQRARPDHPGSRERRIRAATGERWCNRCHAWLSADQVQVSRGLCREHQRAVDRERYAQDLSYRAERREHAHARKRGIAPVPVVGQECLIEEFEGRCAYCPEPATTWDHVIPIIEGGATNPGNIVPSCRSCNSSKKKRDVWEWLAAIGREIPLQFAEFMAFHTETALHG